MRTALVGYGLGGAAFHAPFIAATEGLELSAVVTANPRRRAEVAQRYPSARLLSSLDEVWTGGFDLVVITTPNRFHATHARQVLEHGLNVVVDKPFAASAAQARALASLASARGLLLVPFHNRRWDGDFLTVRKLLATGALGAVHRFESRFERYRPEVKSSWKESGEPEDLGSILFDLGTHLVDQSVALFGRPRSVHAEIATVRPGAKADDDVFLSLTHDNGVRSHLWMSALAADLGPRFRVLGHDAAYVKHGMDPQEERLRAGEVPAGPGWGEEPESAWGRLGGRPHRTEPGAYQDFYAAVAAGTAPVSPQDAVTGLEVLEAAEQSAATGESVRL
ncbi:Predicted dehydrogenase [Lentzea xinjiangensis]|uniref:Predicted dehydrogenase n=1 Tax=Lentzea xinjiangensis TaxID=402600 RepID=A0A1H9MQX6_9PSEU|nr:Gfo/Idh/MocA family oxidoreductase [Lentzea xinjiangensis]SER26048.1 Predicted dehydrogenase [Lentzea xinjiangensis]